MSLGLTLLILTIVFAVVGTFNTGVFISPWFLGLSGLLTLNLLGCTARRLRGIFRDGGRIPQVLKRDGHHRFFEVPQCPLEKIAQEARGELGRLGFKVRQQEYKEGRLITGRKNSWGALGSPLLHISLVLIIAGSVIGGIWSHSRYYEVKVPGLAHITRDGFPFDLEVKRFSVQRYEDGSPRQYTSLLGVVTANQPVLEKAVSVNNPLHYQGVKVYQTAFGYSLQGAVRDGVHSFDFEVEEGQRISLGGPARLELEIHWPRYIVYSKGIPFTMGIVELKKPVKLLDKEVVITARTPYTGLEVKSDPGLPLVWAGFVLLLLALPVRLYIRPSHIWLLLTAGEKGTKVHLAAQYRMHDQEQEEQLSLKLNRVSGEECSLKI